MTRPALLLRRQFLAACSCFAGNYPNAPGLLTCTLGAHLHADAESGALALRLASGDAAGQARRASVVIKGGRRRYLLQGMPTHKHLFCKGLALYSCLDS